MAARRLTAAGGQLVGQSERAAVVALVRERIADGTLKPGAALPAAATLARDAGCRVGTCRAALGMLVADGTLTQASRGASLRVPVVPGTGTAGRAAPRPPVSAALAARRHAAGLSQLELAGLLGVSHTAVGHAETGRLWQARDFWAQADQLLGGGLLLMYDQHQARGLSATGKAPDPPLLPVSVTITPDGVAITWADGTETLARPPGLT